MASHGVFLAIFLASFIPPLFFAIRLRNAERSRREPWQAIAKAFLWGAFGATLLAFLVESVLFPFVPGGFGDDMVPVGVFGLTLAAVVVAPIVEELSKAFGLRWVDDEDPEPEDGLIYGAMAGLGFAATENALYIALAASTGGQEQAIATAVFRSIATVSLHGVASAVAGYGIWAARRGGSRMAIVTGLLGAMLLHAAYNALASIQLVTAAFAALLLAVVAYMRAVRRIKTLDRQALDYPPGNL